MGIHKSPDQIRSSLRDQQPKDRAALPSFHFGKCASWIDNRLMKLAARPAALVQGLLHLGDTFTTVLGTEPFWPPPDSDEIKDLVSLGPDRPSLTQANELVSKDMNMHFFASPRRWIMWRRYVRGRNERLITSGSWLYNQ